MCEGIGVVYQSFMENFGSSNDIVKMGIVVVFVCVVSLISFFVTESVKCYRKRCVGGVSDEDEPEERKEWRKKIYFSYLITIAMVIILFITFALGYWIGYTG